MLIHATRERRQYEPDFVVFTECMSRKPYSYLLMLIRDIGPDAVILGVLAEGEELWRSMLERKNVECSAAARNSPGGAAPSSQA
jgi:hypothetical protein